MSNFPVPSEPRLEQLISESHEYLPGPDMTRLEQIEGKLSGRLRKEKKTAGMNKYPWWIVLLLTGGFAAAAWWTGEQWFGTEQVPEKPRQIIDNRLPVTEPEQGKAQELHEEDRKPDENEKSPVIYRKESY